MTAPATKPRKTSKPNKSVGQNGVVKALNGKPLQQDRDLVVRCLRGDVVAWQEMYQVCQPQLLITVRSLLKPSGGNLNLAEEIASRVWLSLVNTNGNLLKRYDAHRGCRLTTFIAALARNELLEYWRAERRLRSREQDAIRRRPKVRPAEMDSFNVIWEEFVETLTQREREFLEQVLLAPPSQSQGKKISQTNLWQLRSRVLAKLKHYSTNGKT
jgi:DNA-directed RNA polymerase specialized sigma24 family protein